MDTKPDSELIRTIAVAMGEAEGDRMDNEHFWSENNQSRATVQLWMRRATVAAQIIIDNIIAGLPKAF